MQEPRDSRIIHTIKNHMVIQYTHRLASITLNISILGSFLLLRRHHHHHHLPLDIRQLFNSNNQKGEKESNLLPSKSFFKEFYEIFTQKILFSHAFCNIFLSQCLLVWMVFIKKWDKDKNKIEKKAKTFTEVNLLSVVIEGSFSSCCFCCMGKWSRVRVKLSCIKAEQTLFFFSFFIRCSIWMYSEFKLVSFWVCFTISHIEHLHKRIHAVRKKSAHYTFK